MIKKWLLFVIVLTSIAKGDEDPRYYVNTMKDYTPGDDVHISPLTRSIMNQRLSQYVDLILKNAPPGTSRGDSNSWDCFGGYCGAAMTFYKLAQKDALGKNETYQKLAEEYMKYALRDIKESNSIGFMRASTGVYTMCALIFHKSNPILSLDCVEKLNNTINKVSVSPRSKYFDEYDFGRAGLIMAALMITESNYFPSSVISRSSVIKIAHQLFQNGVDYGTNGILAWKNAVQPYSMYGQNHGSTGMLMQLFRLPEMMANETVSKYIRNTIDFFLTIQFPSGNFPEALKPPYPLVPDVLIQWCHGSPGFIPVLTEAYLHYKDERYYESLQKAATNVWEKGILTKGLMLCHGISGNTYMMYYAYKAKSDNIYLYRASKIQEFVLSRSDISDPYEMRQPTPNAYIYFGSSYFGAIVLWSDMLYKNVDYYTMNMPGFATTI